MVKSSWFWCQLILFQKRRKKDKRDRGGDRGLVKEDCRSEALKLISLATRKKCHCCSNSLLKVSDKSVVISFEEGLGPSVIAAPKGVF